MSNVKVAIRVRPNGFEKAKNTEIP